MDSPLQKIRYGKEVIRSGGHGPVQILLGELFETCLTKSRPKARTIWLTCQYLNILLDVLEKIAKEGMVSRALCHLSF